MKNLTFTFIFILLANFIFATTTYLNFEVIAPTEKNISLYVKDGITKDFKMYKIVLKHDNKVSTLLDLYKNTIVDVECGEDRFRIFLRPGDDISTQFIAHSSQSSLQFTGKGSENNQLYADYQSKFKSGGYNNYEAAYIKTSFLYKYFSKIDNKTPSEYFKWMNEEKDKQLGFLMKNGSNKEIDPNFFDYIKDDIEYTIEAQKLAYLISKQDKLAPGDFNRIADHYQLRKTAVSMSGQLMEHPAYMNYLFAYAHFLFLPNKTNSVQVELEYYNKIDKNTSGRAKYFLLSHLLQKVYTYEGSLDLARKKFSSFKDTCPYPEYTGEVEKLYGELMIDMPERAATDFEIVDIHGMRSKLSHYQGKVVYVSFWASWCKPCINSFNKSIKLRADLKKMGVVLLNVSIDEDPEAWEVALEKVNPYGINAIAYDLPKIKQDYGLSAIPAYFIINKKGKFAYLSDEQNRDLLKEFRDLVNE